MIAERKIQTVHLQSEKYIWNKEKQTIKELCDKEAKTGELVSALQTRNNELSKCQNDLKQNMKMIFLEKEKIKACAAKCNDTAKGEKSKLTEKKQSKIQKVKDCNQVSEVEEYLQKAEEEKEELSKKYRES
eukprot:5724769-Ditylum_brightwellii.AAC.1